MRKKLLSIFLLFLFSIVIAFPGYGLSVPALKKNTESNVRSYSKNEVSLLLVLKKCLSKGISIVEEERSVEEDDENTQCKEVCYLMPVQNLLKLFVTNSISHYHSFESGLINRRSVPYPPPNN